MNSKTIEEEKTSGNNYEGRRDEILSEPQAAEFLKVSQMTLFRWRNDGRLGHYRPGGWRVTYSKNKHLLPFLENCERMAIKN
jgi:excisionase family DNA binding protein